MRQSIARFRRAIRLRPDFDRACYNLGTVFYAFACAQQSSVTQRLPSRVTQVQLCCSESLKIMSYLRVSSLPYSL